MKINLKSRLRARLWDLKLVLELDAQKIQGQAPTNWSDRLIFITIYHN